MKIKCTILLLACLGSTFLFGDLKSDLFGAKIIANDGTFLGKIGSEFDSKSIFNEFSNYGSEFSGKSIFNEFGQYGSEFSSLSPFNEFTSTPPKIITSTGKWLYLTANTSLTPRISVLQLRAIFE
jgi:hypothetical protein